MQLRSPRLPEHYASPMARFAIAAIAFAAFADDDAVRVEQRPGSAIEPRLTTPTDIQSNDAERAPEFTLLDQFGKSTTIKYPCAKVNVFILADREGSKQIEPWVRHLYGTFADQIEIRGIALLKGVPAALRSTVRYIFKKRVNYPVLMDWDGDVTNRFPFKPNCACVVVVNAAGEIVASEFGAISNDGIERIHTAMDNALAEVKRSGK